MCGETRCRLLSLGWVAGWVRPPEGDQLAWCEGGSSERWMVDGGKSMFQTRCGVSFPPSSLDEGSRRGLIVGMIPRIWTCIGSNTGP